MVEIILKKREIEYLLSAAFLSDKLLDVIKNAYRSNDSHEYKLIISLDDADKIRNLCGEQLQVIGFDQDYNLTEEGCLLEDLVDKFFID
jgi:hypothetical protein